MIIGTHFLLYSKDAEADRTFLRDVLDLPCIDVGHGWLIFGMSPAEAAVHPMDVESTDGETTDGEVSQKHAGYDLLGGVLYLMCDDLEAFIATMKGKNVECSAVQSARWGTITTIPLPSGGRIGMYQPRHQTAFHLSVA